MKMQLNALIPPVDRIIGNDHNHLQNQWIPVVDIPTIIKILEDLKVVLVLDTVKDLIKMNLTT